MLYVFLLSDFRYAGLAHSLHSLPRAKGSMTCGRTVEALILSHSRCLKKYEKRAQRVSRVLHKEKKCKLMILDRKQFEKAYSSVPYP